MGAFCWRACVAAAGFFAESEHAQALGKLKQVEPSFNTETFLADMTEFVIPEVVEAFWRNDQTTLQQWCTDAVCATSRRAQAAGRAGPACG